MKDDGRALESFFGDPGHLLDRMIIEGRGLKRPWIHSHDLQPCLGKKSAEIEPEKSTTTDHTDAAKSAEISRG